MLAELLPKLDEELSKQSNTSKKMNYINKLSDQNEEIDKP